MIIPYYIEKDSFLRKSNTEITLKTLEITLNRNS